MFVKFRPIQIRNQRRHLISPYDDHFKKDRLLHLEFSLRQMLWADSDSIKMHDP